MLKENWRFVSRVERFGDFLIIIASFVLAYYGRDSLMYWNEQLGLQLPFEDTALAPLKDYFIVLVVSVVAALSFLELRGAYGSMRFASTTRLLLLFASCSFCVFLALAAGLFILKIDLSRSFIGLFCLLLTLSLTFERILVLHLLRFLRSKGYNYRNIFVIGIGRQTGKLVEQILSRSELGVRVRALGHLQEHGSDELTENYHALKKSIFRSQGYRVPPLITQTAEVQKLLEDDAIDEVIFTNFSDSSSAIQDVVEMCAEQGVRTTIAADLFSMGLIKSGVSHFGDIPLIHFQPPPGDRWELSLKRCLDFILACFLLLLLSPVFLIVSLLIKCTSKGPVFFVQKRVGLNGRVFNLIKFRSMVQNAEEELTKLKNLNEMKGPAFKLKNDPRVTTVGAFIRRYSIDELPQLWNVLKGEMSLVGPRPPIPGEVKTYERHYRRRLSMRPGITCIWQVSGRNEINDFESWLKLDLEYIDNWSLGKDLRLLFKTIPAVILGSGAS